ncbi:MAG: hypothetical protein GY720_20530 [bacterium]|nr:hypothetical protein [bacterium]
MNDRRTSPSFVSYIERSARYYEAQGYSERYAWAHFDDVPFTPLAKPLSQSRIGVVTTSYFHPENQRVRTFYDRPVDPYGAPLEAAAELDNTELFWAKDETHTNDTETYLPLARLGESVAEGRIGSLSPRFYGAPTSYSQRRTIERDAPAIEGFMAQDEVDVALLVPL